MADVQTWLPLSQPGSAPPTDHAKNEPGTGRKRIREASTDKEAMGPITT